MLCTLRETFPMFSFFHSVSFSSIWSQTWTWWADTQWDLGVLNFSLSFGFGCGWSTDCYCIRVDRSGDQTPKKSKEIESSFTHCSCASEAKITLVALHLRLPTLLKLLNPIKGWGVWCKGLKFWVSNIWSLLLKY
jgi:hypothetical protein